jgi:hypothetical protein
MLRLIGAVGTAVAFVAAGSAGTPGAAQRSSIERAALLVTLPMTNGFADATDALVDTQRLVHEALDGIESIRLVDRPQDSDAVLTVLGRGTGHVELTAALKAFDRSVIAMPVMLHPTERYVQAMLTVGSCDEAATNATSQGTSVSCYRKIFVGLGFTEREARKGVTRPAPNSWKACADALARDVQAWVSQNAGRLLALRG